MIKRAAIIGAGVSGLASSIWLARMGFEVDLYEKNATPGGKLSEIRASGYRFDTGPSLFTLPQMIENLFSLCEVPVDHHLAYDQLDIISRYFYEDGTIINAFANPEDFAREIESKTDEPADRVIRFLEHSRELYELTNKVFIFNAFHHLPNLLTRDAFRAFLNGWKMEPFTTMHRSNSRRFSDHRIVQLFDRYATYNGSNPYIAPATLNVIAHLEHNLGAYFPKKGMYQIVRSLLALAEKMGVRLLLDSPVESIHLDGKRVKGIVFQGEVRPYDFVVSGIDIYSLYKHLLPVRLAPSRLWRTERSSSALIFYWGVRNSFPQLELHNIFFSDDYANEFDHIFNKQQPFHDPTVYLFISSKVVQQDAPAGCENWFVMINTPPNRGQNWDELIPKVRHSIIRKLNRMLDTNVEQLIEFEEIRSPVTLENLTGSAHGAIYGTSSNSPFAAFYRHPNYRKQLQGLYFTGGSVHPGGGIPLCLASAGIMAEMVVKNEK